MLVDLPGKLLGINKHLAIIGYDLRLAIIGEFTLYTCYALNLPKFSDHVLTSGGLRLLSIGQHLIDRCYSSFSFWVVKLQMFLWSNPNEVKTPLDYQELVKIVNFQTN